MASPAPDIPEISLLRGQRRRLLALAKIAIWPPRMQWDFISAGKKADLEEKALDTDLVCSAKGCRQPATWALRWNNPKIHTPDRRKTWLACDEHKASLSEFLDRRGFLREVRSAGDQSR